MGSSPQEPPSPKQQNQQRKPLAARARARTEARQRTFLRAFEVAGTVTGACALTGTGRRPVYDWTRDARFAEAFDRARDVVADRLEEECRRRAVTGTDEPVYYQGNVVGHIRKYSDGLLVTLLNAYRPEKFKRRAHTDKDGGSISVVRVSYDANMTPDDMEPE